MGRQTVTDKLGLYSSHLRFAEDIVLLSKSAENLYKALDKLVRTCGAVGLKINISKSNVILNKHDESALFCICSETLEQVKDYNYLGQVVSAKRNHEKEIRRSIVAGWGALRKHSQILKIKLPLSHNRRIYDQCVLRVLTCGAETWRLTRQLEIKLRSTQWAMERRMIGVTLRGIKFASWIKEQTRVEDTIVQIKEKEMDLQGWPRS